MERFVALLCIVIILPLGILLSLLLFFSLKESVIFSQLRIGKKKKEFTIYKFKTMKAGKITFLGKLIRKLGLDEIPQLFNILKNEMSFVGPRPLVKSDITRLKWDENKFNLRWSVKPGITCLAQLSSKCSAEHSMERDLFYVMNKSLVLDIKILTKTLMVPFFGKRTN